MAELSPLALFGPPPFAADHHLDGRPVLPAVEAMEHLAAHLSSRFADIDVTRLANVRFDKFLFLDPDGSPAAPDVRIEALDSGRRRVTLETRRRVPGATMTRVKAHAAMTLGGRSGQGDDEAPLPLDIAACLEGVVETVGAGVIYNQLVPFGPGYRNLVGEVMLSADGVLAQVRSPAGDPRRPVLGSPYVLDAAFHAACVWGQRYAGQVAFPVALTQRRLFVPTEMAARYWVRVVPIGSAEAALAFDLYLYDSLGRLCEAVRGVEMRDVSGGRRLPPAWLASRSETDPLAPLEAGCRGACLVALDAAAPFAADALSPAESARLAPMAPRRARAFVAGRLALKRLARRLDPAASRLPAPLLDTTREGSLRPRLPKADGGAAAHCALSHDGRFAVAVAAEHPVGVDVEVIGERPLKVGRLFMSPAEQRLCTAGPLAPADAALRIWSAKEAAAKAADIPLTAAWRRFELAVVDSERSVVVLDGQARYEVVHARIDDHLFTLLVLAA